MLSLSLHAVTVDRVSLPVFNEKNIKVACLRLDKIHPVVSGNKWFKLKYYLEDAIRQGKDHIVTFGGAFSNHIIATAAACKMQGLRSTGIIRGEEATNLSPTLNYAKESGMQLIFISREEYRDKEVPAGLDDHYLINEGGYGIAGVAGAATIAGHFDPQQFTHICCAVGTGTMMAGLINASSSPVIGISVLKNNRDLEYNVQALVTKQQAPCIIHDYHFGGYAKHTPQLTGFMNDFYRQTGVPSDFVYTGKLFYGTTDLIRNNYFPGGSKILLIHSGGLQGNVSLNKGTSIF